MTEGLNEDKVYKVNHADVREEIRNELAENLEKFRDPVVLGVLVSRLLEERENTNRILKGLVARIEQLEAGGKTQAVPMLPKVDEDIMSFLREGPKTAEDVRKRFGYKGKNAASARLNRLHDLGAVVKRHVGKQVYFTLSG